MGKLNVLGAQRVKALIEILKGKMKEELDALPNPYNHQVQEKIKANINVCGYTYDEIYSLKEKADKLFTDALNEIRKESDEQRKQIQNKYKDKENKLWLCETLEEAKEIVGIK
jgi:hypothetical protein